MRRSRSISKQKQSKNERAAYNEHTGKLTGQKEVDQSSGIEVIEEST